MITKREITCHDPHVNEGVKVNIVTILLSLVLICDLKGSELTLYKLRI
jgi:hypothetical protein